MEAFLESLISWGAEVIVALQALSTPALDALFILITLLGQEVFFLILLPTVFWCVGKGPAMRLALLLVVTVVVNEALKGVFVEPRPFMVNPAIEPKLIYTGYSFPSGHAQVSATVWPAMAHHVRRRWFSVLAGVMVVAVSLSRVYLGVHYPHDVAAGALVGLAILGIYLLTERRLGRWLRPTRLPLYALFGVVVPVIALAVQLRREVLPVSGAMVGATIGFALEQRYLRFRPSRGARRCGARVGVGMGMAGALFLLAEAVAPRGAEAALYGALAFGLYVALGLTVTYVAPWLFARLGLAERE